MPKCNIECYHRGSLKEAPKVAQLINKGDLKLSGKNGVCDARVPADIRQAHGQDVSCVGPSDPNCPDPTSAKIIPDSH